MTPSSPVPADVAAVLLGAHRHEFIMSAREIHRHEWEGEAPEDSLRECLRQFEGEVLWEAGLIGDDEEWPAA